MKLIEGGRFAIREAFPGVGRGMFTVYDLASGEFIVEYTGKRVPTGSAEDSGSRYLFMIDHEWTIDGPVPENVAGYLNHACEPNCEAVSEKGRIMFYTKRHIRSGEELTIDYGPEYFNKYIRPHGCRCATCINPR